ncbi:uncharacterized protein LOC113367750 [Ctenocephalides felis]|uniref:uncharacterized protein LOC113367750 n=1 Tax=Ctenocephalides felis TaxID=7515 RepID=UPI000E6E503E|nr:uncharacterized protein LOC113367750 [Ctenocephalides felis]
MDSSSDESTTGSTCSYNTAKATLNSDVSDVSVSEVMTSTSYEVSPKVRDETFVLTDELDDSFSETDFVDTVDLSPSVTTTTTTSSYDTDRSSDLSFDYTTTDTSTDEVSDSDESDSETDDLSGDVLETNDRESNNNYDKSDFLDTINLSPSVSYYNFPTDTSTDQVLDKPRSSFTNRDSSTKSTKDENTTDTSLGNFDSDPDVSTKGASGSADEQDVPTATQFVSAYNFRKRKTRSEVISGEEKRQCSN